MYLPQNTRTRISVAARIKTRLGKIEEDYVDGKKDRGRGTAIGVVQDQLSPLLWVALYLPQNPKTRSNTHIAIKIAADGFRPNKKNAPRGWRPYR